MKYMSKKDDVIRKHFSEMGKKGQAALRKKLLGKV